VIVIGGGMTAVDAAVQAKLLGAENVTIVYRRGKNDMNASSKEQKHATSAGVRIITNVQPKEIVTDNGVLSKLILSYTKTTEKGIEVTSEEVGLKADQVFRAIGQNFQGDVETSIKMVQGKISIDDEGRTSNSKIWAGGDCATGGDDLTVTAVAQGRDSAVSINNFLTKIQNQNEEN
jgi:glutamate synthase (NADPH/NADH) small chain